MKNRDNLRDLNICYEYYKKTFVVVRGDTTFKIL